MKIIISPAKRMRVEADVLPPESLPVFLEQAQTLAERLKEMTPEELQKLLGCNASLAQRSWREYQQMNLRGAVTPSLLAFDGIQYKYMAPQVFSYDAFDYVREHLRILSGLYGILRPFDAVEPYRLEMQARLGLYDFWGDRIYRELTREDDVILNLASEEYARAVKKYMSRPAGFVTCVFGEMDGGRIREKGVHVKMARGEMVRYLAENKVRGLEGVKTFQGLGYRFRPDLSEENRFVFIQDDRYRFSRLLEKNELPHKKRTL